MKTEKKQIEEEEEEHWWLIDDNYNCSLSSIVFKCGFVKCTFL